MPALPVVEEVQSKKQETGKAKKTKKNPKRRAIIARMQSSKREKNEVKMQEIIDNAKEIKHCARAAKRAYI